MTVQNFIEKAQAYYNARYNKVQLDIVVQWLQGKSEKQLNFIWAEVLKNVSLIYKTPPGIKELEDAYKIIKTDRARELHPNTFIEYEEERAQPEVVNAVLGNLAEKLRFKGGV